MLGSYWKYWCPKVCRCGHALTDARTKNDASAKSRDISMLLALSFGHLRNSAWIMLRMPLCPFMQGVDFALASVL